MNRFLFGWMLCAMPGNVSDLVAANLIAAWIGIRTLSSYIFTYVGTHWLLLMLKALYRYTLRSVLIFMVRVVIMCDPRTTNAQVRARFENALQRVKSTWFLRSLHPLIRTVAYLSALIMVIAMFVMVGLMRVIYLLVHPILDMAARTAVGQVLRGWYLVAAVLLHRYAGDKIHKLYVWLMRRRLRLLRKTAECYRRLKDRGEVFENSREERVE